MCGAPDTGCGINWGAVGRGGGTQAMGLGRRKASLEDCRHQLLASFLPRAKFLGPGTLPNGCSTLDLVGVQTFSTQNQAVWSEIWGFGRRA